MSTISASTTSNTAFKVTSDTTGTLVFQTGAVPTTAISIDASQAVSIGSIAVTGVTTFSAGSAAAPSITTTGDTNTGIFFPAADTIAFTEGGVESMRIDSSGNVGIGTTNPAAYGKFTVVGTGDVGNFDTASGATGIALFENGSGRARIRTLNGSTGMAFLCDSTEGMRLDSSGNLGLGVTPSAWSATSGYRAMQIGGVGIYGRNAAVNELYLTSNAFNTATGFKYIYTAAATQYAQLSGSHVWYTAASGTAGNTVTFTQAMTLTADGNLGLGTTSPETFSLSGHHFEIDGRNGDYSFIHNRTTNVRSFYAVNDVADLAALFTYTSHPLTFGTNNTERARITAAGEFCIGKTTISESATAGSGFGFASPTNDPYFTIVNNTAAGVNGCMYLNRRNTQASNILLYFMTNDGTTSSVVGSITHNGTATAYNTSSDYRLKTVIGAVNNAGQRIDALQPVEYTWNDNGERARGFLAHQFQEVYASSVSGTKDAVDAEGKPVYQSMQASTSEVIADLVAELQSVRARLAALESK